MYFASVVQAQLLYCLIRCGLGVQAKRWQERVQLVASVGTSASGALKPCQFCLFDADTPPEVRVSHSCRIPPIPSLPDQTAPSTMDSPV